MPRIMGFLNRLFGRGAEPPATDHDGERAKRAARPPLEKPLPKFPFPMEACHGSQAMDRLARLREQGRREGFTAVLLGGDDDVANLDELPQFNSATVQEYLAAADGIAMPEWFQTRREIEFGSDWEGPPLGDWPARSQANNTLLGHVDMGSNRPKKQVFIARLPTKNSWEVFAHLRYGDWNACPKPEEHVAIVRSWHQRFGAEVVAVTHDTVELEIARPPRTREEATAVAWEQYWYCNDIVDQGVETINNLASSLMVSKYWFFWWD